MTSARARSRWLRSRAYGATAVAYAAILLATLPIAPKVWFALLPHLQPHVTLWYVGGGLLGILGLVARAHATGPRHRGKAFSLLALALGVYLVLLFTVYRNEPPAKKIHLVEYSVMALIALQAVRAEEPTGIACAAVFLFVVGTVDEVSQGSIPMRTFRWLDLFGNYTGSLLGAAAWAAASPWSPWRAAPVEAPRTEGP